MNRLKSEKSLYLRQHATNPVDWFPWGDEAFHAAKNQKKPILLSIGYSACHWCHVMAHESFENAAIAQIMNDKFICIKVDREERPDVDHVFQTTGQLMQVQGGWPLTVFLTPEGNPFYVGTYFPPDDKYGRPGFSRLLNYLSDTYRNQKDKIENTGQQLVTALHSLMGQKSSAASAAIDWMLIEKMLWGDFDTVSGGFGSAPKFPHSQTTQVLARMSLDHSKNKEREKLIFGLRKMAQGGIYDHVGGGFHRYSTDDEWLVPHFEKMLYDNALLPRAYLDCLGFQGCDSEFVEVVTGTLDYVLREMTSSNGAFFAAQDADSEGHEGKFFVWTFDELRNQARTVGAEKLLPKLGVTTSGNFEGKNILHLPEGWLSDSEKEIWGKLREKLFEMRETRVKPGRDEKCIVAWNGLMITTCVQAGLILGRQDYLKAAQRAFTFISSLGSVGSLPSVIYGRERATVALLDDYAAMTEAALALYQATSETDYLELARSWADHVIHEFWDETRCLFRMNSEEHEKTSFLPVNPLQTYDGSYPSGNSVMVGALQSLASLTDEQKYIDITNKALEGMRGQVSRSPQGFTSWLMSYLIELRGPQVCQVVGAYTFDKACALRRNIGIRDVVIVWGAATDDFSQISAKFLEQWKAHAGREGYLSCNSNGCQPLTPEIPEFRS